MRWSWLARALLHGVTTFVVLLALAGGVARWQLGRLCALNAGHLTGIEQLLPGGVARGASASHGLHGINPYVRFTGLDLRTAEGMKVTADVAAVELDTFKSLVHFTPILAGMELRNAVTTIEQAPDGQWLIPRVKEKPSARAAAWGQPWRELWWESGGLEFADFRVRLHPAQSPVVEMRLLGRVQNHAGAHRGDLRVSCAGECGGELAYQLTGTRLRGLQDGSLTFVLRGLPHILGAIRLGDAWLDVGDNHASGNFAIRAGKNALQGNVLASVRLRPGKGGSQGNLDAQITSRLIGGGEHDFDMRLADLMLHLNDRLIPLPDALLARRKDDWFGTLPDIQIQSLIAPIAVAGVLPQVAANWLQKLDPRAVTHGLRWHLGKKFTYATALDGVFVDAYSGSPLVHGLRGSVLGDLHGGRLTIFPGRIALGFPDVYDEAFNGISVEGPLDFWYGDGGFALHSGLLKVETGDVHVAGRFALQQPRDPALHALTLMLEATDGRAEATPRYLPKLLEPGLRQWLVQAVGPGHVAKGFVGLHLYTSPQLAHHAAVELAFEVDHTAFKFLPGWPRLDDIVGHMSFSNGQLLAEVSSARSGDVRVTAGTVSMQAHDPHLALSVRGTANPFGATSFLLNSPLRPQLAWLADWQGSGDFPFDLNGKIALSGDAHVFTVNMRNAATALRNDKLHVALSGAAGNVRYDYPRHIEAKGIRASLNQKPVVIDIASTPDDIVFNGRGRGDGAWLNHWLPWPMDKATNGAFDYAATLRARTGAALPRGEASVVLDAQSDLRGIAVNLPAPLIKAAEAQRPLKFHLEAVDDLLRLRVDEAQIAFRGQLRGGNFENGVVSVGNSARPVIEGVVVATSAAAGSAAAGNAAAGSAAIAPTLPERGLIIAGVPDTVDLLGWSGLLASGSGSGGGPLTVDLDIGHLLLNTDSLPKAHLRAATHAGTWRVDVEQQTLDASLQIFADRRPMQLTIARIRLPRTPVPPGPPQPLLPPPGTVDPPDPLLGWQIKRIPQMNVAVESLQYGDEVLGKVKFDLQPTADGIELQGVTGALRNIAFTGARLTWQRDARGDRTLLAGTFGGKDLATVLEAFGFAGSVRSEAITLRADFGWPGSPANYAARRMEGTAHLNVRKGHFVQVAGANAARVLGVFDFASIARRARLDFSDVFGKGLSFDSIDADLRFSGGVLSFPNTLRIEGPGSAFRLGGTVNLATGVLDNDMIVTLPLSRTLPWYAAYAVFTANPLAGAGVLVAERLLRDRLDQFSSAKYHVDGTIEAPQVKFVSVFSNQVDQPRHPANPAGTLTPGDKKPVTDVTSPLPATLPAQAASGVASTAPASVPGINRPAQSAAPPLASHRLTTLNPESEP